MLVIETRVATRKVGGRRDRRQRRAGQWLFPSAQLQCVVIDALVVTALSEGSVSGGVVVCGDGEMVWSKWAKEEMVLVKEGVVRKASKTMSCQDLAARKSGVVIRLFWPTRKQTSETDYPASSVVALVEAGTYGIASEEDTGRRLQKVGCPCRPLKSCESQVRGRVRQSSAMSG